ncbi:MAG TPA: hypothetical protein VGB19_07060 [Actinomycetota bacterium]
MPSPLRARRHFLAFFVVASLVVGALVLGLTTLNAMLSQTSFRVEDLSSRVERLQKASERKELQVATLSAPGRIEREARQLGMRLPLPSSVQVIHVRGSRRSAPAPRALPPAVTEPVAGGVG